MRLRIHQGTNLHLAFIRRSENVSVELHELPAAFDGVLLRFQLKDGEATDQFFGLSKRAVNHGRLSAGHTNTHALGAGAKSTSRYQRTLRCCLTS